MSETILNTVGFVTIICLVLLACNQIAKRKYWKYFYEFRQGLVQELKQAAKETAEELRQIPPENSYVRVDIDGEMTLVKASDYAMILQARKVLKQDD